MQRRDDAETTQWLKEGSTNSLASLPFASVFLTTQLCDDWCFYHLYVRKISLLEMH